MQAEVKRRPNPSGRLTRKTRQHVEPRFDAEKAIGPQPGPQTAFLETEADIAFYGGAAGGGKTFALLLEPLRHYNNKDFGGVIFRRNTTQVRNRGGLWDESAKLYGPLNSAPIETRLEWKFPSGAKMKFAHLEHETTVFDWQGSQIPFIGFDEVTHFSEQQFFYMLSRNRSTSGVPGYVRATCNPSKKSWVRKFIDWWIGDDGFPIAERAGKIRWFIRRDDALHWADSREELLERFGADEIPKSVTFIPSKIWDNQILLKKDPSYLANLRALPRVERQQLLDGNWDVEPRAGEFFNREWFGIVDAIPAGTKFVRYWDRAASPVSQKNPDPDWTRGVLIGRTPDGFFIVADLRSVRGSPMIVEQMVRNTASQEPTIPVYLEQDPGSAGVADVSNFTRLLAGRIVHVRKPTQDKETRARALSAQAEAGNVKLLRAKWNDDFLNELNNFPDGAHDDIVDAASGGFNELVASGVSDFTSRFIPDDNSKQHEWGSDQW